MLDRTKLIKRLSEQSTQLENQILGEQERATYLWDIVCNDESLAQRIQTEAVSFLKPSWEGSLNYTCTVNPRVHYRVVGVDGSQLYPDRHEGMHCFVINIGIVDITYGPRESLVTLETTPHTSIGMPDAHRYQTPELVNALRTGYEFEAGYEWLLKHSQEEGLPELFLFDGSLIFWHLQTFEDEAKRTFLPRYIDYLGQLYEKSCLYAGYISLPKSREIINILRVASMFEGDESMFEHLLDVDIMSAHLALGARSVIFKNHSPVTKSYPEHSKPYFYYLNTGNEIARIEIPAWIACDERKLALISQMIMDQVNKGNGYPIALSESHEAAVITMGDKEFFYHCMRTLMPQKEAKRSQKRARKHRSYL